MPADFQSKQKKQPEQKGVRKRLESKTRGNPKLVFWFLAVTIILSGIFWLKSNISALWEQLMQPARYEFINPEVVDEKMLKLVKKLKKQEDVVDGVKELTRELTGIYGVYVYELEDDEEYGVNEDEVFMAASVNKVLIMAAVLQEIEKGNLTFEDQYRLQRKDIEDYGTGTMRYDRLGTLYTYEDLLELTGKKSDNTAAFVLSKIVGNKKIDSLFESLKMENTSIKDNTTTPKEIGRLFVEVYKGELLSSKMRDEFYGYLANTDFEDRIPMGVPDAMLVAHKIGSELNVINDCGIVFEKDPYVLCILSKNVNEAEALEVLPKISRLVWEYEK